MLLRIILTYILVIAFSITAILPPGYASEDSLRSVATRLAGADIRTNRVSANSSPTLLAESTPPGKHTTRTSPSIVQRASRRLLPVASISALLLLNGCKKKRGQSPREKLIMVGAFIGAFALSVLCYKCSDERKEIEKTGDHKALKRWKQGAPWVIIIGTILSIFAYVFSDDETELASIQGLLIMAGAGDSNSLLGHKAEVTGPEFDGEKLLMQPLPDRIGDQLAMEGPSPGLIDIAPAIKGSPAGSAGRFERISRGSLSTDAISQPMPTSRGRNISLAIATQA